MSESQISNEVNQQFLRRTPVKLRQFSRLLKDMLTQEIDPLRVKALVSQVTKTREACVAQEFETTAKLLNQLLKQLSLNEDALETQKPLLKRLSQKLDEHSQKLELGVRPAKAPKTSAADSVVAAPAPETTAAEPPAPDSQVVAEDSLDEALEAQGIYLDKGVIIFVSQEGERYANLQEQFESLGIEVHISNNIAEARQFALDHQGSVIVAPLKFADHNEQLSDEDTEHKRIPLIFTAEEDSQEERLLALRSGGTGFMVEPISLTSLIEHIESQYDIHADSPYRILVMEDSKAQARYYEKVLGKGHFDVRIVNDPRVLLEALRGFEPETVLMDMQMPTCSGIELTRIIRQMPRFAYLPIIFLSAEENLRKQNQALLSGGTSFIVKPVQKEQLMFLAELYCRRYRDLNPHIGENPDTGLTHNISFKQKISVEAARTSRNGHSLALSIIQLDQTNDLIAGANFSLINVAVQQLSLLLKKRLRKTDVIGHLETGQIGVILTTGKKQDWVTIMDEIRVQFRELPFHLKHHDTPLSISIGLSAMSTDWDAHRWFESCLEALNRATANGGDSTETAEIDTD